MGLGSGKAEVDKAWLSVYSTQVLGGAYLAIRAKTPPYTTITVLDTRQYS